MRHSEGDAQQPAQRRAIPPFRGTDARHPRNGFLGLIQLVYIVEVLWPESAHGHALLRMGQAMRVAHLPETDKADIAVPAVAYVHTRP